MSGKYWALSVVLLAGTCVGVTPAWSAQSKSSSSDQSQEGSMGQSGTSSSTDTGSSSTSRMSRRSGTHAAGQSNVKQVQEALKDKGFDPGPIDGVMGQKTREALRSFQQSKNIKVTGRLDSETAQQLGVSSSSSGASSSRSSSNMGASGSSTSSGMGSSNSKTPSDTSGADTSNMPSGATRGSSTGSGH